jgi:hypothetical protein
MKPPQSDNQSNVFLSLVIGVGLFLLLCFVAALAQSKAGEIAAAMGSVIGGIVGASGAVGAVYLLINRQRHEDANNASDAIRREVIEMNELVIQSLKICEQIKLGNISMVRKDAPTIMERVDPIVYKAVADRIGLVPHPHLTVKFYMRLVEIQQSQRIIAVGPGGENAPIPIEEIKTLAKSFIIACRFAQAIISHEYDEGADDRALPVFIEHIETALESAKRTFPPRSD